MYLRVTVGAAPVEEENRITPARIRGMARRHMALGAEPRVGHLEQPIVNRTVGFMTVGAVFEHGRMLVKKWPAPFGVARIAVFVHADLPKLSRIGRPMGIMAVGTSHLPFS